MVFNVQDYYFQEAKKQGYVARSAFKLQEINEKFKLFTKQTHTVIDIGCAPGSRIQYAQKKLQSLIVTKLHSSELSNNKTIEPSNYPTTIIGFDLKKCFLDLPGVFTYVQDVTDTAAVEAIIASHQVQSVDCIMSDMAPDTIGNEGADARRSIALIRETLRMYERFLKPTGTFAIKVFMGPGFPELFTDLKKKFGGPKHVKIFKPKACRKESKETYIVKV